MESSTTKGNQGAAALGPEEEPACAHSPGFRELWVPIIEKAFAKYFGSYGAIEEGFVHHALQTLTGAPSECLFLCHAARGAGKAALWRRLLRYKRNGFILGAGTVAEHLADRHLQGMGLQFASTYTIYDVRVWGPHRLLKLRNPPGDHEEWKGDWSDASNLWTSRMKRKLDVTDEEDNTFWMSYDDFVNAFRTVFVCKYKDKNQWVTTSFHSAWSSGSDTAHESAAGLPSKHNPGCEVENNPQWTLHVHRPVDVYIRVSQTDAAGRTAKNLHPFAAFLVRARYPGLASRVKELTHDNVVEWSGQPHRTAEVFLSASNLAPGTYTLLAGAYVGGLEGPVSVEVVTNFKIRVEQLWPPVWAPGDQPVSMVEKLAAAAAKGASAAAAVAKEQAAKAAAAAKEQAAGMLERTADENDDDLAV